jgi:hypothetical protein
VRAATGTRVSLAITSLLAVASSSP